MTVTELLSQLEALSDVKMHKRHVKHGADPDRLFGVRTGDIRKIAKKLKNNHQLGLELWKTRNYDARLLAILIMKPAELSREELNDMASDLGLDWVADWFNSYVLKESQYQEELRVRWLESDNPWQGRCGWNLTASKIVWGAEDLDLKKILDRIEKEMPTAAREVQWTMNIALAYTGINHPEFRKRALEIGEKLGIYRDYPVANGCTSPFAPIWINEMVSRQKA
ncbi:MAG: DNA alkylation repair protein [Ignavibacteriaceae bacterium]|nr:DNA alkylation repair protein [Ignavibacteriaceae bacterium]